MTSSKLSISLIDSLRQQIDNWLLDQPQQRQKQAMELISELMQKSNGDLQYVADMMQRNFYFTPPPAQSLQINNILPWQQGKSQLQAAQNYFTQSQQAARSLYHGLSRTQNFPSPRSPTRTPSGWWLAGKTVSCTSECRYAEREIDESEAFTAKMQIHGNSPHDSQADNEVPHTGLVVGELTGWRLWRVTTARQSLRLLSQVMETIWKPGTSMKGNLKEIPRFSETDPGIYVWKTKEAVELHLQSLAWNNARAHNLSTVYIDFFPFIIGQARLWGEVVEHEHGYRAERAEVHSLERLYGWEEMWYDSSHWTVEELLTELKRIYLPESSGAR